MIIAAVDLGKARTGIAVCDKTEFLASPHTVIFEKSPEKLFEKVKEKYPDQKFMADCSTVEEALFADEIGFDFIGTTLVGYTPYSVNDKIEQNDFEIIRKILKQVHHPVIAEGNIDVPQKARRVVELGCYSVVVGGAITRPQLITKKFTNALIEGGE